MARVDADGHGLAFDLVPAPTQDLHTLPALDGGKAHGRSLRLAILDRAFTAKRCRARRNIHGMSRYFVAKEPDQKDFAVPERR